MVFKGDDVTATVTDTLTISDSLNKSNVLPDPYQLPVLTFYIRFIRNLRTNSN